MKYLRKDKESGFTLIELLIVVVVLGILAAIVIFAVGTFRSDSVQSACRTDAKSVETAAQAFKAKTGAYPTGTSSQQIGSLVPDYLKAAPNSTDYTITLNAGTVTVGGVSGCP